MATYNKGDPKLFTGTGMFITRGKWGSSILLIFKMCYKHAVPHKLKLKKKIVCLNITNFFCYYNVL